jgi:hypothetical protein
MAWEELPLAPGFTLMRLGDARREFRRDPELGCALKAYGGSGPVPRAPDHYWVTIREGAPLHERCETRAEAIKLSWYFKMGRLKEDQRELVARFLLENNIVAEREKP